jgi:hypothetical protein
MGKVKDREGNKEEQIHIANMIEEIKAVRRKKM